MAKKIAFSNYKEKGAITNVGYLISRLTQRVIAFRCNVGPENFPLKIVTSADVRF
jgi:hypothetical protein